MTDSEDQGRISQRVHNEAAAWFARREKWRDAAVDMEFKKWLNEDSTHRSAYEEAERNWRDGLLLAESDLGRERQLGKAPFLLRRQTHVAAASLCVAAAVGIVAIGFLPSRGPFGVVGEAQAATYQTGVGEIRTVALTDGSKVTLDTQSRVDLSAISNPRRLRLVKGRARFDVVALHREPFVVTAGQSDIVATGTTFDVSLTASGAKIVSVRGAVEVHAARGSAAMTQRLADGEQAEILSDKTISAPTTASPAEARWVSGMLALNSTGLGDAVAAINRYNRVQVELADPGLATLRVSGAFRSTDPDGFAAAVAAMFHLRIAKSQGVILLIPVKEPASAHGRK